MRELTSQAARRIARDAAEALEAARPIRALVGFDGFLDAICDVVDTRRSMVPHDYTPIRTMAAFSDRVRQFAGLSTNLELVVREERFGGNGPLMAGGLASLGASTTYIGAVGREDDATQLHPAYAPFAARCAEVVAIAPTARTDALEFHDGKLMLNVPAAMQEVTWDRIVARVGLDNLRTRIAACDLLAIVNWSIVPGVEGIWEGLLRDGLHANPPRIFLDLSDPAKRTDADILRALAIVTRLAARAKLTLGLNLAEATRLWQVLDMPGFGRTQGPNLPLVASELRQRLALDTVVIHPRDGAAASDATGAAWFPGPFTPTPRLSTGAGDHFNAGFALAQCSGLGLMHCLASGVATSGVYVRDAASPTMGRLCEFLRDLPILLANAT